jgi:hypothetical protein
MPDAPAQAEEIPAAEDAPAGRSRAPVVPPSFKDIVKNYSGTSAEWLLGRIIGWHERITPDREKDIDAILYLLEKSGYIPGAPETAPFIATIALIWARLPLAADLTGAPRSLLTPGAIGDEFRKVAEEMQWITRKEFQQLDGQLDRFTDNIVDPKLEKFQHILDGMAQKINALVNARNPDPLDVQGIADQIAGRISQKMPQAGKSPIKGIYLAIAAIAFVAGLLAGSWAYAIGFAKGGSQAVQPVVSHSAK